ncbi:T6SS immunity protein Tli4 family protein, partial [Pseudomonas aeruginosa]
LSWSSEVASKTYLLDTYVTSKPTWHAYRWKGKVSVDREQRAIEMSRTLARNLRSRAPKEIPSGPGFCIDQAYIAGDNFQDEEFGVGVTFPNHPGVDFEFRSLTGAAQKNLLERVGGLMQELLSTFAGMETLRKGKHPVGSLPGEEY